MSNDAHHIYPEYAWDIIYSYLYLFNITHTNHIRIVRLIIFIHKE